MILQTSKISKQILGSSLIFSASGGRDKEKKEKPAGKIAVGSEGEAEGGCGGNSASPEPKRSPAALLVKSRTPHKSFLFLLEEKEIARQIKKCEENFFAEQRAKRAAAGRSVSFVQKRFAHFQTKGTKLDFVIFCGGKQRNARRACGRGSQGIGR